MKRIAPALVALSALLCAVPAIAQTIAVPASAVPASAVPAGAILANEPAWLSLERGRRAYADKEFGAALMAFETAIETRRDSFSAAALRLDQALLSKPAVEAGDSISAALAAFAADDLLQTDYRRISEASRGSLRALLEALRAERISDSHRAFIEALLLAMEYGPPERFGDSIGALRRELDDLVSYPEAEYWKGKVFLLEGELELAERQFLRAFDMRQALDVPEDRYAILYDLAALYRTAGDDAAWEAVMKRILADDPVAGEPPLDPFLRQAMMDTLLDAGFDRFMTLYRLEPSFSLEANGEMGGFYLERGRASAPLHAAVAVNMVLTRAVSMLRSRDRDYAWAGLDDFLSRIAARRDITEYLAGQGLNKLLLTLGDALYVAGARRSATPLWRVVAASGERPYAGVAARRLAEPASAVRTAAPPMNP